MIISRYNNLVKIITAAMFLIGTIFILTACSIESKDEKKSGDLEFEVISKDSVPAEFNTIIDQKKKELFKTTYSDKDNLYIAIGYGEQPTGGYSISVTEMYETKNGIYVKTEFKGPSKKESVTQEISYPYIVIKTKASDKSVVFK